MREIQWLRGHFWSYGPVFFHFHGFLMHFTWIFTISIIKKPQKWCFGCEKNREWWKNLFFQETSEVGWIYPKNRQNENWIISGHFIVIFWSIFGGSKTQISILKTSFVKNAKITYFGCEKNSKTVREIRFFRKVRK